MDKNSSNIDYIQREANISKKPVKAFKRLPNGDSLDTLALLSTGDSKKSDDGRSKFIKKQIAKSITMAQLYHLIDVKSPLTKSYWNTWHCNNIILQEGYKLKSKYCNARWCNVCNRVRMAKMINAYSIPLLSLNDIHFVTLTAPNVDECDLKNEVLSFFDSWRKIYKNIKQRYKHIHLKGMRKFEITFKPHTGYNPHFHFIIEGREASELIVKLWLDQFPNSKPIAQDIRKANDKSLLELFKYAAKGVHKGKFYPYEMDKIYQSLYRKKTYYPLGIKKYTSEDVDEISSQEVSFVDNKIDFWLWDRELNDWRSGDELLTGYIIEGNLDDWIKSISE